MKKLIEYLKTLKGDLKKNKQVIIIEDNIDPVRPIPSITAMLKDEHPKFSNLDELFALFTNIGVSWKTQSDENFLNGEFFFGNILNSIEGFWDSGYSDHIFERCEGFSKNDGILIFDQHPEAGDGIDFLLRFPEGKPEYEIWGHNTKETVLYKLSLTIPQYVHAMCHFKCIYNWQWLFIANDSPNQIADKKLKTLGEDLQRLKLLFPEVDIAKRDF